MLWEQQKEIQFQEALKIRTFILPHNQEGWGRATPGLVHWLGNGNKGHLCPFFSSAVLSMLASIHPSWDQLPHCIFTPPLPQKGKKTFLYARAHTRTLWQTHWKVHKCTAEMNYYSTNIHVTINQIKKENTVSPQNPPHRAPPNFRPSSAQGGVMHLTVFMKQDKLPRSPPTILPTDLDISTSDETSSLRISLSGTQTKLGLSKPGRRGLAVGWATCHSQWGGYQR